MTKVKSNFFSAINAVPDDEEEDKVEGVDSDIEDTEDVEDTDKEDTEDTDIEDTKDDIEDTESEEEIDDDDFYTTIINDQAEKGKLYYDPDKEYEGSGEEIFDEVIEDTLEKRFQEEYLNTIPEEYHSIFDHLKAGKSLDEWVEAVKPTDYSKINLEDESNQKTLIEDHLTLTGMDEEDIKELIEEYESAGTLEKNATKALKYLKKNDDSKAETYKKQLEQENKEAERIAEQELREFKAEVLGKEELGKLKLSKIEREKLFEHITKPVNKRGESALVVSQKDREKQLLFAYLDMKGFDFKQLEKEVETKVTKGLRAKLTNSTDINATNKGGRAKVSTESKRIPKGAWDAPREVE